MSDTGAGTSTKPTKKSTSTKLTPRPTTRPTDTGGQHPQRVEPSPQLKELMRRLKLGRLLDTLPERLALARTGHLAHHDFL